MRNCAHYASEIFKRLNMSFFGLINYISACYWGVKIGKGCKFMGRSYLSGGEMMTNM